MLASVQFRSYCCFREEGLQNVPTPTSQTGPRDKGIFKTIKTNAKKKKTHDEQNVKIVNRDMTSNSLTPRHVGARRKRGNQIPILSF